MKTRSRSGSVLTVIAACGLAVVMLFSSVAYASSSGPASASSEIQIGPGYVTGTATTEGTTSATEAQIGPGYVNNTESTAASEAQAGPGQANSTDSVAVPEGPGGQTGTESGTQSTAATATQITIDTSVAVPTLKSDYAILYDATIGQVFYEKNADTRTPPASTVKLLVAMVVLEQYNNMSTVITFDQSIIDNLESGATTARMKGGDTLTVEQALNAILVGSSCDVAAQLATSLAGSEVAFAALMNQKAVALGCANSNFANASGLNSDAQYTTVRDMALITSAALSNDTIRSIISQKTYTLPATSTRSALTLTNTNHFTTGDQTPSQGYVGGKTGYTSKAGHCLAMMAEINGHKLVAVVMKASGTNAYDDCNLMYDYGRKLLEAAGIIASDTSSSDQTTAVGGSWEQTAEGMKYKKADGSYYVNEWLDLNGESYFFDSDGIMCTGWQRFSNGTYYYFDPDNGGAMVKNQWVLQNGKSYYMSSTGVMATNTVIDGKYRVDETGLFVEIVG